MVTTNPENWVRRLTGEQNRGRSPISHTTAVTPQATPPFPPEINSSNIIALLSNAIAGIPSIEGIIKGGGPLARPRTQSITR